MLIEIIGQAYISKNCLTGRILLEGFRDSSFPKQLATVIFILLILVALLSQPFPALITLARALAIILGCLFIWLIASSEGTVFRKLIGLCFIIIILLSTLLFWIPFSSNIIKIMIYSGGILFLIELTIQAKLKPKATFIWLIFVPLLLAIIGVNYFYNDLWWVPYLAFPLSWSFMALYAESNHFKSIINLVGIILLGSLVVCYIVVNIYSLASISGIIENEYLTQLFNYSGTVPIIQLGITLIFIPFIISWGISLLIFNKRDKIKIYFKTQNPF